MIKLLFVLLGSFWLSCGNTPESSQNKTVSSEEKTEIIKVIPKDTLLKDKTGVTSEETVVNVEGLEEAHQAIEKSEVKEEVITLPDHTQWNTLLGIYVDDKGNVDYKNFSNDISTLEEYLNHLDENSPKKNWSKNEKLAYYINLYNAATVELIVVNYPTKSIKDIKNPWGRAWVKIGDSKLSLGAIEHKILRKMDEPRIHFAINCASFSCPKLLNEAFTSNQMESQLEKVTLDFINDPSRNIISKDRIQLSNIFKWYKKDFTESGTIIDYIKAYTKIKIGQNTDIEYLNYDWNLNEAKYP